MKKSSKIVKTFLSHGVNEETLTVCGHMCRLIRYKVNKETKEIVYNYHSINGVESKADDLSSEYILITNIMDEPRNTICKYYRMWWQVEVSIRDMKTNFDVKR